MKVTKVPNRFFPDRAFSVEDLNRDLSHASNIIQNDQDARYVYSSIRIPCGIYTSKQVAGPQTVQVGAIPAGKGPKQLTPGNHEAIRTFAFVPPMDMKLVSTDFYVKGCSEDSGQIKYLDPMIAKVQWVVDDGGEGYPPRPKSHLPEGMVPSGDIDITRVHDQITVEIESQSGFYARTDNGEYTLRAGKCYRVMVSDPDIPSEAVYNQSWYWRYKLAWIQLNLKYDKWQFDKIDRPDVTFKNANDKVELTNTEGTGVDDQLNKLQNDSTATKDKKKYPKPELHYFGLGQFNGYGCRPSSVGTTAVGSKITNQTDNAVTTIEYDCATKKAIPDLSFYYNNDLGDQFVDTKYAHNFAYQAVWRSAMAASIDVEIALGVTEDILRGKEIWGYSVGLAHNVTRDFWDQATTNSLVRHPGYMFHATLGHGLYFDKAIPGGAPSNPRQYSTWENNVVEGSAPFWRNPNLRLENVNDDGALFVGATAADKLYRNDTIRGSTAIPEADSGSDPRGGQASGFPGDYLAELHSGTQYGTDPNVPSDASAKTGDCSTGHGTFDNPNVTITDASAAVPGNSANQNFQDDLFTIFHTLTQNNTILPDDSETRNFQKIYVLLWVV